MAVSRCFLLWLLLHKRVPAPTTALLPHGTVSLVAWDQVQVTETTWSTPDKTPKPAHRHWIRARWLFFRWCSVFPTALEGAAAVVLGSSRMSPALVQVRLFIQAPRTAQAAWFQKTKLGHLQSYSLPNAANKTTTSTSKLGGVFCEWRFEVLDYHLSPNILRRGKSSSNFKRGL